MAQKTGAGTSVLQRAAGIGEEGTGQNESGELSTFRGRGVQTGQVVGSWPGFLEYDKGCDLFAPVCRPAAREGGGTAGTPELTSDCSTLHPHARAAAPPSGRSFFLMPTGR